jgi:exopolysaccharide biosynthesis protein
VTRLCDRWKCLPVVAALAWFVCQLVRPGVAPKGNRVPTKPRAYHIVIDLRDGYAVRPELASPGEKFADMIVRLKPYAAITGTYYDENGHPLGDLLLDGRLLCRGPSRQGIGFTKDGQVLFLERRGKRQIDWRGCVSGISCGPRLIRAGKLDLNPKRDGFSETALIRKAPRCAIGATRDGKLVMCAVSEWVTVRQLANYMLQLGASDAVNLDGGAMTAFYARGKTLADPVLPMNNVLTVFQKQ